MKVIIFGIILLIVLGILALLPEVDIDEDAVMNSSAWQWVLAAAYFIPTHTVVGILAVVFGMAAGSIIVAVVKTIWDILPFA